MNTTKLRGFILFILICSLICTISLPMNIIAQKNNSQGTSPNILPMVLKERATIPKPKVIKLIPDKNIAGVFIVKFVEGSHIRYREGNFTTSKDQLNKEELRRLSRLNLSAETVLAEIGKVNELVANYGKRYGFAVFSTFADEQSKKDPEAQFREKEKLEITSGQELADLDLYFNIAAKDFKDLEAQQQFMNALNESAIIEDVHGAFLSENAEAKTESVKELFNPNFAPIETPDFSPQQGYLNAAPTGIDARYAWTIPGGRGSGVKVIDVEYDWQTNHEDFASSANLFFGSRVNCQPEYTNHGTAVMGILNAPHNGFGVNGITPDIRYGLSTVCRADGVSGFFASLFSGESVGNRTGSFVVASAINAAAHTLSRGDVLLIELQAYAPGGEFVPEEYYLECFDAIQRATAQNIVVVEAAGNGGMNLDDARYTRRFDSTFRHSGALMIGASKGGGDANRAGFSNFGSRVDVHGWGGRVVSLGYGVDADNRSVTPWNLGDVTRHYTQRFGGTSSASPIVAGAVASIQGARRSRTLEPLDSSLLRMLFISTGTPQDSSSASENIGPLPNLRGAIDTTLSGMSRAGFTGPGTYFIQARHSNKVLDVNISFFGGALDGRPVAQFDNYNGDNQKFIIERVTGPGEFVTIKPKHTRSDNKCLDVSGFSRDSVGLQQWQCNGGENQQFAIERVGDFFKIRAKHSGLYFDISGASLNNSARLIQYPIRSGDNQLFQFIPTR